MKGDSQEIQNSSLYNYIQKTLDTDSTCQALPAFPSRRKDNFYVLGLTAAGRGKN